MKNLQDSQQFFARRVRGLSTKLGSGEECEAHAREYTLSSLGAPRVLRQKEAFTLQGEILTKLRALAS